jgi:hypothetical protein
MEAKADRRAECNFVEHPEAADDDAGAYYQNE